MTTNNSYIDDGFRLGRTIGSGALAKVKVGTKDGIEYALKIFRQDRPTWN